MAVVRAVHIITRLILGGAQENTVLTCEGLLRTPGYDVTLVTGPPIGPEGELIERARANGVPLRIVPEMRRELHPARDVMTFVRLCQILRELRPHIVHTHSSKAGILGRLAARIVGVPVVVHTVHGPPFFEGQAKWLNAVYVRLERMAARFSHRIISVADAMTQQFLDAGIGHPGLYRTIYSGMEVDPFLDAAAEREATRAELDIKPDEIVIGKIARLFELKGHEDVIRAAPAVLREFPRARLLFVGDGILRDSLIGLTRELGIRDRFIFAGLVDPAEIPRMVHAMDLVVHASYREGLARVLPQAMLCGRPVVTYDADGAPEVVRPGETGFLVPKGSVDGLAEAMLAALRDPDTAAAMARRGRELFERQFRAETMVEEIDGVYGDLLRRTTL